MSPKLHIVPSAGRQIRPAVELCVWNVLPTRIQKSVTDLIGHPHRVESWTPGAGGALDIRDAGLRGTFAVFAVVTPYQMHKLDEALEKALRGER